MKQFGIALLLISAVAGAGFFVMQHTTIVSPPAWEYKVASIYEVAGVESYWELLGLPRDTDDRPSSRGMRRPLNDASVDGPSAEGLDPLSPLANFGQHMPSPQDDTKKEGDQSTDSPFKSLENLNRKIAESTLERISTGLSKFGAEGWELVAIDDNAYYFKRRRSGW